MQLTLPAPESRGPCSPAFPVHSAALSAARRKTGTATVPCAGTTPYNDCHGFPGHLPTGSDHPWPECVPGLSDALKGHRRPWRNDPNGMHGRRLDAGTRWTIDIGRRWDRPNCLTERIRCDD